MHVEPFVHTDPVKLLPLHAGGLGDDRLPVLRGGTLLLRALDEAQGRGVEDRPGGLGGELCLRFSGGLGVGRVIGTGRAATLFEGCKLRCDGFEPVCLLVVVGLIGPRLFDFDLKLRDGLLSRCLVGADPGCAAGEQLRPDGLLQAFERGAERLPGGGGAGGAEPAEVHHLAVVDKVYVDDLLALPGEIRVGVNIDLDRQATEGDPVYGVVLHIHGGSGHGVRDLLRDGAGCVGEGVEGLPTNRELDAGLTEGRGEQLLGVVHRGDIHAVDIDLVAALVLAVALAFHLCEKGVPGGLVVSVGLPCDGDRSTCLARVGGGDGVLHDLGVGGDLADLLVGGVDHVQRLAEASTQPMLAAVERAARKLQLPDLAFQLDPLDHERVAGRERGHFRHGGAGLVFELHDERPVILADAVDCLEFLRVQIPHLGIDGALCRIGQHLDHERVMAVLLVEFVALPDDPAFALLDVGRLPGHVHMVEPDKALLHVGAGAHARGAADDDADLAGIDLCEQIRLLSVGICLLCIPDFCFRDPLGDKLALDVVIGVPPASEGAAAGLDVVLVVFVEGFDGALLGLLVAVQPGPFQLGDQRVVCRDVLLVSLGLRDAAVQEHDLRALVRVPLLVEPEDVVDHGTDLAGAVLDLGEGVHRARIEADLPRPVHQPEPGRVALLEVRDAGKTPETVHHTIEKALLRGIRLDRHGLAVLAAFHDGLDARKGELRAFLGLVGGLHVLHGHGIGHRIVEVHQGAHVGPLATEARHLLEPARLGWFPLGRGRHVHRAPGVETFDPHVAEFLRREVPQHQVHFSDGVADRGASEERHGRAGPVVQGAEFQVKVHRLPGPGLVAHACGVLHPAVVGEVLELVGLIDGEVIDPHFLEGQKPVPRPFAELLQPFLELRDKALGLGHAEGLAKPRVAVFHGSRLGFFDGIFRAAQFFIDVGGFRRRVDVDEPERAMPHDGDIEVTGGDLDEQPAAVLLFEVLLGRGENPRARVEELHIIGPLLDQVVRDHDKGFLAEPHTPALHEPGDGGEGLARADRVVIENDLVGDPAPGGVDLVGAQLHDRIRHLAGEGQVGTVALPQHARVEPLVEQLGKAVAPRVIHEDPIGELRHDLAGLGLAELRGLLVNNGFRAAGLILDRVGHLDRVRVEQLHDDLAGVHFARRALGPPLIRGAVVDREEGVGDLLVADPRHAVAERLQEIGIDLAGDPRTADGRGDGFGTPRLGLHRFQRLDVLVEVRRGGGRELAAHGAGEVGVGAFPCLGLRVEERERLVSLLQGVDGTLFVGPEQGGDPVDVHAAGFGERQAQGVGGAVCLVCRLRRVHDPLVHDRAGFHLRRALRGLRFLGDLLGGERERTVRHGQREPHVGGLVQDAVRFDERLVGVVQGLAVLADLLVGSVAGFQLKLALEGIPDREHVADGLNPRLAPLVAARDLARVCNDAGLLLVPVGDLAVLFHLHRLAVVAEDIFLDTPGAVREQFVGAVERRVRGEGDFAHHRPRVVVVDIDNQFQVAVLVDVDLARLRFARAQAQALSHAVEQIAGALRDAVVGQGFRQAVDGRVEVGGERAGVVHGHVEAVAATMHCAGRVDLADHLAGSIREHAVDVDDRPGPGGVRSLVGFEPHLEMRPQAVDPGFGGVVQLDRFAADLAVHCFTRRGHVFLGVLAEEQHIGDDLGARVFLEGVRGQADRTCERGVPGDLGARAAVEGIHQVVGDDHPHDAAGGDGLDGRQEELVVDGAPVHIGPVREMQHITPERGVADGEGEAVVGDRHVLEAGVQHLGIRVEQLGDARGEAVVFDGENTGLAPDPVRHQAEEVPRPRRGLKHRAAVEAQPARTAPDGLDHGFAGVVGGLGAVSGGLDLVGGEQVFEGLDALFPPFGDPAFLTGTGDTEGVFEPAPPDISGKDALLVGGGPAVVGFDGLEGFDGRDVVGELLGGAALTEPQIIGDLEVSGRDGGLCRLRRRFFGCQASGAGLRRSRTCSSASCFCAPASIRSATLSAA